MSNVFLGQIIQGGWNFPPRGFHTCDGSLLAISTNTALFSLLGTNFGGNGTTTFGLPDFRGRRMVGWGQGPGLSNYVIGQTAGTENTALTTNNLPAHTHTATFNGSTSSMNAATSKATLQTPAAGTVLARSADTAGSGVIPAIYQPSGTATTVALGGLNVAGTVTVSPAGSNQPFSLLDPYQVVTVVIALQGIFPSRN